VVVVSPGRPCDAHRNLKSSQKGTVAWCPHGTRTTALATELRGVPEPPMAQSSNHPWHRTRPFSDFRHVIHALPTKLLRAPPDPSCRLQPAASIKSDKKGACLRNAVCVDCNYLKPFGQDLSVVACVAAGAICFVPPDSSVLVHHFHPSFFFWNSNGCPLLNFIKLLNIKVCLIQLKKLEGNKENKQDYTKLSSHNCNWRLRSLLALSLTWASSCLKTILQVCRDWCWFLKMTSFRADQIAQNIATIIFYELLPLPSILEHAQYSIPCVSPNNPRRFGCQMGARRRETGAL
jgi:hypothetical protein